MRTNRLIAGVGLLLGLLTMAGQARGQTVYAADTFAGTSGTNLSAHTGDAPYNITWTATTGAIFVTGAGRIRPNSGIPNIYQISAASTSADYTVQGDLYSPGGTAGNLAIVMGRLSVDGATYYGFGYWSGGGGWVLYRNTSIVCALAGTFNNTTTYTCTMAMVGATVTCKVNGANIFTGGTTVNAGTLASGVWTDGLPIVAAGKAGVYLYNNAGTYSDTTNIQVANFSAINPAVATPLSASLTASSTNAANTVTATVAGGTPNYTAKFYRDIQPVVVTTGAAFYQPSAGVGPTFTLTDSSVTAGTVYYYALVVTDTAAGSASPPHIIAVSTQFAPLKVAFLGDSNFYGLETSVPGGATAPPAQVGNILSAWLGSRPITVYNQGISGTRAQDWQPGGSNYTAFKSAVPAGVDAIDFTLGTNDCNNTNAVSAANFRSGAGVGLQAIVTQLLTDFPSAKIFLNYPIYFSPNINGGTGWDETSLSRLLSYQPQIDAIVAADASGRVKAGDKLAYAYFARNYLTEMAAQSGTGTPATYYLHVNDVGSLDWARMLAVPIYKTFYAAASVIGRGRRLN